MPAAIVESILQNSGSILTLFKPSGTIVYLMTLLACLLCIPLGILTIHYTSIFQTQEQEKLVYWRDKSVITMVHYLSVIVSVRSHVAHQSNFSPAPLKQIQILPGQIQDSALVAWAKKNPMP